MPASLPHTRHGSAAVRTVVGGFAAFLCIGIAALLWPETMYDQFIWQYFWGPIQADAAGTTVYRNGIAASSGYTLVNGIGYGGIAAYLITVLVTVLRHLDVGGERNFVLYFVPFIFSGGMLRVVEDIATQTGVLSPPLQYLLISPLIYFTMFGIVFAVLLMGVYLQQTGIVSDYRSVILAAGSVFAVAVLGLIVSTVTVSAGWMAPGVVLGAGTVLAAYALMLQQLGSMFPAASVIVHREGLVVLYGHLLDGISTALSLDRLGMTEKHPIPSMFISYTGTPYAFIGLKLAVMSVILYYMFEDGSVRHDDPVFFNLILLGILAVGMGPGTRNTTRAIFGV